MANELQVNYDDNNDGIPYVVIRRSTDNYVWSVSDGMFVVWNDNNYAQYGITTTSQGGDSWTADFPPGIDTGLDYITNYYERLPPATYDLDDLLLKSEVKFWNGQVLTDSSSYSGWKSVFTVVIRNLINDTVVPYRFADTRIHQAAVIAGIIATQQFQFSTSYSFNMNSVDISPDPTVTAYYDALAIALFTLKAACILTVNDYHSATRTSIKIKDGDSAIETAGGLSGYKDIINTGPCATYNELIKSVSITSFMGNGKAVLSPYSSGGSPHWGNESYLGIWNTRTFFNSFLQWI